MFEVRFLVIEVDFSGFLSGAVNNCLVSGSILSKRGIVARATAFRCSLNKISNSSARVICNGSVLLGETIVSFLEGLLCCGFMGLYYRSAFAAAFSTVSSSSSSFINGIGCLSPTFTRSLIFLPRPSSKSPNSPVARSSISLSKSLF